MAKWEVTNSDGYLIHTHPTFIIKKDSFINFDTGQYDLTIVKKIGMYKYNLYVDLWRGIPGKGGVHIKQLLYYDGRTLAYKYNHPSNSKQAQGTISTSNLTAGTYYVVMACECNTCTICKASANNSITCKVTKNSKEYNAAAFKITKINPVGNMSLDAYATGKTVIATPEYSGSNTYTAATDSAHTGGSSGKIYVWINNDESTKKLAGSDQSVTFTGLTNNNTYQIKCACYESTGNYLSATTSVKTYKTTVTITGKKYTSLTAKIEINNSYSGQAEWWSSLDTSNKKIANNNSTIEITDISPGQQVTIYAIPKNMPDAEGSAVGTTLMPTTFHGNNNILTGTTCTVVPVFTVGNDDEEVPWRATLADRVCSGEGSVPAKFDMLANGTVYGVSFKSTKSVASTDTNELKIIELSYDVKTYACQLQEHDRGTNDFSAVIYQTKGAVSNSKGLLEEYPIHEYDAYCTLRDGNVPNGEHVGACTISEQECSVSGLSPDTSYRLYVWLTQCKDFNGYYDAVGYIDFTTKPTATAGLFSTKVTGRTITVKPVISRWNGSASINYTCRFHKENIYGPIVCEKSATCDVTTLTPVIATNLNNGTKYYIETIAVDNNGNNIEVSGVEVITYGLKIKEWNEHSTYIGDAVMYYTDGERSSGVSQDSSRGSYVRWYVTYRDDVEAILDGVNTLNCRRSNPTRFNTNKVLYPNSEYTLYAYVDGVMYEGVNDTLISINFSTTGCASDLSLITDATGETISATAIWEQANTARDYSLKVTCTLLLNGVTKGTKYINISEEPIVFTGLERGKTYTLAYSATDNEGNTSADWISYLNEDSNGTVEETTYKLTITDFEYNTRSIRWKCTCNREIPNDKAIEYYIAQPDDIKVEWDKIMESGTFESYTELKHNTQTTFMIKIRDMVDQNGNYDTLETIKQSTKKFSLSLDTYNAHVHTIDTIWQAYANSDKYDKDTISNTGIEFVPNLCSCVPAITGKGKVGDNYGMYRNSRIRYFNGLTGGRKYKIKVAVTDGINVAISQEYSIEALIQLIRIYDANLNKFRLALPYIYHDKKWYKAPMYLYHNKKWHDTNPEQD